MPLPWAWPPSRQRIAGDRGQPAGACEAVALGVGRSALDPVYVSCCLLAVLLASTPGHFSLWGSLELP